MADVTHLQTLSQSGILNYLSGGGEPYPFFNDDEADFGDDEDETFPPEIKSALKNGDLAPLREFLANGGDPNALSEELSMFGIPEKLMAVVLQRTLDSVRFQAVQIVADAGGNINARALPMGDTPLMVYASRGDVAAVRYLLARGASLHSRDWMARTALHEAARCAQAASAKLLLRHGARLDEGLFVIAERPGMDAGKSFEDRAEVRALLHEFRASGGTWKGYVGEPRLRLCELRTLCASGRATPPASLRLLFSDDRASKIYLPDALFRIVAKFWWAP